MHKAKKFTLITVLYNEKNEKRAQEYLTCLEKNRAHKKIASIHVVYDTSKDTETEKKTILNKLNEEHITITYIDSRPTYQFCFDIANAYYPDSKIILANADIYFDETLSLLDDYDLEGKFLALTRWDQQSNTTCYIHGIKIHPEESYSQDTWIFKTPIDFPNSNILIGIPGCDTAIAYYAKENNFTVLNSCLSIKTHHLHESEIRNYDNSFKYPNETFLTTPYVLLSKVFDKGFRACMKRNKEKEKAKEIISEQIKNL